MTPAKSEGPATGTGHAAGAFDLAAIPAPAERRLAVRITASAQRELRHGHPWLFDRSIVSQSHEGHPGDLAVVFDDRRRFLAIGLYDPTSAMRVRILQRGAPAPIDGSWFAGRLGAAAEWRATLPETGTTGYRLVHGENDGLPGLVVDRYADVLVLKLYSVAWLPWLPLLRSALAQVCPARAVVVRLSREVSRSPQHLHGLADGQAIAGTQPTAPVGFTENGLRFEADVVHGQKTGFFFDQRDNRARVERLAAGRRTLNVFAYTGGFSLYAARGGAPEVLSVDASAPALDSALRNFALNRDIPAVARAQHSIIAADAFQTLERLGHDGQLFDLVVVDPPSLAKRASEVVPATETYRRLAELALHVTAPGGILVMASCSSRVSPPAFFDSVNDAAFQAGRPLKELDRTGHAIDHPVLFPEGAYLKCLFAVAP